MIFGVMLLSVTFESDHVFWVEFEGVLRVIRRRVEGIIPLSPNSPRAPIPFPLLLIPVLVHTPDMTAVRLKCRAKSVTLALPLTS